MGKQLGLALVVAVCLTLGAQGADLNVVVEGQMNPVEAVQVTVCPYDQGAMLIAPGAAHISPIGAPDIPWQVVTVLLPPDTQAESVQALLSDAAYMPVAEPVTLNPVTPPYGRNEQGNEVIEWPAGVGFINGRNLQAWSQNAPAPAAQARILQVGQLRQYHLAEIAIPLAQYNPVTGDLRLLESATLVVTAEQAAPHRETEHVGDA